MRRAALILLALFALPPTVDGQETKAGVPRFPLEDGPVQIRGAVRPWAYLGDQGRRAAVFGSESGSFEVWAWPVKLVRDLRLAFRIPEYDEPLEAASVARSVVARAEGLTIVYSHPAFTVRQHVFVPLNEPGAVMLLEVESVRPLDVLVRMHADFNLAWPGSFGGGYITWQGDQKRFLLSQGGMRLYNGFVGSPLAISGTTHPTHDAPMVPSQFTLRFDPADSRNEYIPIIIAGGAAARDSVDAVYSRLLDRAPQFWREKVEHYRHVREDQLRIESPDSRLNHALEWAKVNLDQQLACNPDLGCGLVAGFGRAGAGNFRPGFGWYFGGDAAINSFAMDGLGQFDLVLQGLAFLAKYQRADGKIPHEISHAAARLPWFTEYPYTFFHGDTTPFWLIACYEYWLASGDTQFLREFWPNITRAFRWSAGTDSDGDGLMENPSAGAGAIEVGGLGENLRSDIYLAGVWVAALQGTAEMARKMADQATAERADSIFRIAQPSLENFWLDSAGIYAFALLQPQPGDSATVLRRNDALTVWPATAMSFGLLDDVRAGRMLREISSSAITADWGARMLSRYHHLYDPLHYNNGTVWPFVTGFAALAHYRYHRGWAGYDLVRDVARVTMDFARGRTPELLSGAFYDVLDTAVPQQFFATSMMVTPLVRGLIGFTADAPNRAISLEPHLPADWDTLAVSGLRAGGDEVDAIIQRRPGQYSIELRRTRGVGTLFVRLAPALPLGARVQRVSVDDRDVAVQVEESAHDVHATVELSLTEEATVTIEYDDGLEVVSPDERLLMGDASASLKVLDFTRERRSRDYVIEVEGVPGGVYRLELRANQRIRGATGADIVSLVDGRAALNIRIPAGSAPFVRHTVRIRS